MATLQQALNDAKAAVFTGSKDIAQGVADGGYQIRVQRTTKWNSRTPRVVVHVWHRAADFGKARLMKKAEWMELVK
jgi:hypothetical protein